MTAEGETPQLKTRPMRTVTKSVSRINSDGEAVTDELEEEVTDEEEDSIFSRCKSVLSRMAARDK
jgi:hypothetical protein